MYFVVCKDNSAFYTNWYQFENHWNDGIHCVINIGAFKITFDGETWEDIETDHL